MSSTINKESNHHVMKRVRKLIERVLSDDGVEGANALAAVQRWMRRNDRTADWVLDHLDDKPAPAPFVLDDWRVHRDYLNEHHGALTDRELEFVMDCVAKGDFWNPTTKRVGWLRSIYTRVQITAGLNPV